MATGLCVCGIISMVIGSIMTVVCLTVYFTQSDFQNYEVHRNTIVDSPNSPAYPQWQNLCNPKLPPLYMSFWLFNLTNWHDVIYKKAIPNFQKCGPYTYLECQERMYVNFSPDGTNVTYSDQYTYYWNGELSNGTEDDIIINLNFPALAAYSLTGDENMIGAGLSLDYLTAMTGYFSEIFPNYVLNVYFNTSIINQQAVLVESLNNDVGAFYNIWANDTSEDFESTGLDEDQWDGMYLAQDNGDIPTNISLDIATNLWDPSYPYSMVNGTYESQSLWLSADSGDSTAMQTLLLLFPGLTQFQLKSIILWRVNSKTDLVPDLLKAINKLPAASTRANKVTSLSDIGGLQWATGAVVSPHSYDTVFNYAPQNWKDEFDKNTLHLRSKEDIKRLLGDEALIIPSLFPPELWAYQLSIGSSDFFTVDMYNSLFTSKRNSILDPGRFSKFYICLHYMVGPMGDSTKTSECKAFMTFHGYGLSPEQKEEFFSYMNTYIYDNFAPIAFLPVTGAGLIDAETAHQRLWFGPLGIAEGNVTLKDTNSTYLTGKNNISQIDQIVMWELQSYLCSYNGPNCTFLEGFWPIDQPISGSGTGMYFPYGTGDNKEDIYIWDSDILRPVLFNWNETTDVMGVQGYKYVMPASMLDVNDGYDQFIVGTVNLTHFSIQETQELVAIYNNKSHSSAVFYPPMYNYTEVVLPIFLTFADMYYLDENVSKTVTGLQPNWEEDNIYVTIEPTTGLTIEARKMLQENIFLTEERYGTVFTRYYQNITGPYGQVMWPVAVIDEHGTLDKKTADSLIFLIDDIPEIADYMLWVGVPFFAILFVAGVVMFWKHSQDIKRLDYLEINSEATDNLVP